MPANLADAMIRLLDGSANEGLAALSQILKRGQPTLGQLWTSHLSPQDAEDLSTASTPRPTSPNLKQPRPTCNGAPALWIQNCWQVPLSIFHGLSCALPGFCSIIIAATLLPMAGDIQAVLNSQTAGVSDIHAWGLMLPSS